MNVIKYRIETLFKVLEPIPCNITGICRHTGLTYSHVVKLVNDLESDKWITTKKRGRSRDIILTQRGLELKSSILALVKQTGGTI